MKRRIFSVLIALALCLSLLPAPALAESSGTEADPWDCGASGNNVKAWLSDGGTTLTISGSGAMTDYTYSDDRPWYSKKNSILGAVIGEGVTSIGSDVFYSCQKLTSVEIPESVTSIGKYAFNECYVLSGIQLPSGLTSIGENAFSYCRALTGIEIPSGVKTIGKTAFSSTGLKEVTIPDGVESIGASAFSACNSLTTVNIPASVRTIGRNAFQGSPDATIYFEGTQDQWDTLTNGVDIGASTVVTNSHEVTIVNGGEGFSGAGDYAEDAEVTVSAGTNFGYAFDGWTVSPEGVELGADFDPSKAQTTFTMPGQAVTLTANWVDAVATVDNVGYKTVQAAFNAIGSSNGTVYLLKDVSVDQPITMSEGSVTLESEGKTLTGSSLSTLDVMGGHLYVLGVTVKNTFVPPMTGWGGTAISISSGASLTVRDGATVSATGPSGIAISSAGTLAVKGGTVSATGNDSIGIYFSGGTGRIEGGTISGDRGLGLNT